MRWVWHLGGLSLRELCRNVWSEADKDDVPGRAAQLSFFFLLALFPFLIFVSAVLGEIFSGNLELRRNLLAYLQTVMPESAYQLVEGTVREIASAGSGGKISFGLFATLWTASSGVQAIIDGLNVAYNVAERRAWWKRRVVATVLTVAMAILSAAALALVLFGARIGSLLTTRYGYGEAFATVWAAVQVAFPPVFMLLVFVVMYRFAPNVRAQGWQALVPGAFVAVILWIGATAIFRLYLFYFDTYGRTYGSLGAVIILLLWLYLSGMAVLLGGEVNSEIRKAAARAGVPEARRNIERPANES
jgi:membrane protein